MRFAARLVAFALAFALVAGLVARGVRADLDGQHLRQGHGRAVGRPARGHRHPHRRQHRRPHHHTRDPEGDFRFLNLDPGTYTVDRGARRLRDHARERDRQRRRQRRGAPSPQGGERSRRPSPSTPRPRSSTSKKMGTGTTLDREELSSMPNSRDPWAFMRTVPGVLDRPRQPGRLRERPAVGLHRQGLDPDGHHVGARRRRDHRPGGRGREPDLLRLRLLRGGRGHHRRRGRAGWPRAASASTS